MNEDRNREVVSQIYDAFVRKDLAAILALQSEEAEWSVAASSDDIPWASPPGRGTSQVTSFLRILGDWLIAEEFTIRSTFGEGDTLVALGYQRGRVRPTGRAYEFDFVHVWTLRDARVVSFRVYYDTAYVASVLR